jgi:hypothetical protein
LTDRSRRRTKILAVGVGALTYRDIANVGRDTLPTESDGPTVLGRGGITKR